MKVNFNSLLYSFSSALDCVEAEVVGIHTDHGKRVACICVQLGKNLGLSCEALVDLAGCAILHDNALSQSLQAAYDKYGSFEITEDNVGQHCIDGERNLKLLPFYTDVRGAILYHHENADGSGPFGKSGEEIPMLAQLIHIADVLDIDVNLSQWEEGKMQSVQSYLEQHKGSCFDQQLTEIFLQVYSEEMLKQLAEADLTELLETELADRILELSGEELRRISDLFAAIIDYKSVFTKNHSLGLAQKAERMAVRYGYGQEEREKLYLSAAVHDIGKLAVATSILEKPGKLTSAEFAEIKNHAWYSYKILHEIKGFSDITEWAAYHHEKLDGSGYPFGKTGKELGKNQRLMACLDIYQALVEERPYKSGMTHEKALGILRSMAAKGELDQAIVEDIDDEFQTVLL